MFAIRHALMVILGIQQQEIVSYVIRDVQCALSSLQIAQLVQPLELINLI